MTRFSKIIIAALLGFALLLTGPVPSALAVTSDQQENVENAKHAIDELRSDKELAKPINEYLGKAKAVLIFPNVFKAGFIFGGEGGSGLLLVKGRDGTWSDPAFYVIGSASFGLQIGAKASQLILIVLTDGGLDRIMHASVKLGGDVSVAAGPVGMGAQGATTLNAGADILAFSRSQGIYGGLTLDGSVISSRDEWNQAYYGQKFSPSQIVLEHKATNPGSEALRRSLGPQ